MRADAGDEVTVDLESVDVDRFEHAQGDGAPDIPRGPEGPHAAVAFGECFHQDVRGLAIRKRGCHAHAHLPKELSLK